MSEDQAVVPGAGRLSPVEFRLWVRVLHMADLAEAAVVLGVSHETARHWAAGTKPIPYAILPRLRDLDEEISVAARCALSQGRVRLPAGDAHAARVAVRAMLYGCPEIAFD